MMNQTGLRRILPDHLSGSCNTFGTPRYPSVKDPILTKRVCFYKSGDLQFNGLRMVINNRTYKTFDALLDSLSKKVPLPFGVRNITTPRGVHAIYTLDELEDGKSYICSDSRKVKPINLALARKKLPPWYHVRPASSRRRTVQQGRFFPGKRINKQGLMLVQTPKRLLVFRNGDPTQKQTVVLRKRTTPTFESILDYISEIMQFHVVKLHTPDGRRVDGLTGLILCSGTVVAAGREPFRSANYNTQKPPTSTRIPTNRASLRRLKSLNRKKMSNLYSSKPRNFSLSSERYIVNRIQSSIAESSCDLPSNLTNSIELESNHMLESVAETDGDVYLGDGAEGQGCMLPSDDDIEKSFRVNQDGSMTVEMKVRLTIKEEETIHWTTTLTRSSVASQLSSNCFPEVEAEQEVCSPESNVMDSQSPALSTDAIDKDKTKDNSDEDPPSLGNGAFSESGNEEDNKIQTDVVSPRRDPTPGHKQIRKKQVVESIQSMRAEGIQEDMVGSYSYKEHTENGAMTEQYCMVKQSTTRPVPKPRRIGSLDAKNVSTFKSAGVTEILQVESSEDEVTETILHIYEQQTCQDNFLANISGIPFGRPATSETGQFSLNNDIEPELWRPSTASESINIWRPENMSVTSDSTFLSLETGAIQATKRQQWVPRPTRGQEKPQQREADKDKNVSSKPKVINKHVRRLLTPRKRQKEGSAKATEKKMKTFSSAGFIKKIYGNKSKSIKNPMKRKKRQTQNGDVGFTRKSSLQSDDTIIDPETPSPQEENSSESVSVETGRLNVSEVSQPRGILARQTSVHQEKKNENKPFDISQNMSVPACISVTNNYVENWLEKAHLNPTSSSEEESKKLEAAALGPTENGIYRESEYNHWSAVVAKERKCLQEKSEKQPCPTFKSEQLLDGLSGASVKLRIKCFENKPSNPPMEEIVHSDLSTTNTESCTSVAQNNTEEIKPTVNGITTEIPSDVKVENKSSPINSLQKATLSQMNSMELPPPPSPDELMKLSNNNDCGIDVSISSSLYRLSSVSSQKSESHQMSTSPTSNKAVTPTDHVTETPMDDAPSAPLPRTSSVKRVPLISNQALERKMSLRKANVDKYTLCTDATSDTTATSTPINAVCDNDNVLPNGICSTGTQLPAEDTQDKTSSSCTSVSPTSLTSGERMSTASILSSQTSTPSDIPLVETKTTKSPFISQNEALSPKPLMKNAQIISSPSPERKTKSKKLSSEESPLHKNHSDKTTSPNIGKRGHATPSASPATERKKMVQKPRPQQRQSPYSQSLDMASPPVKHRQNKKMLSREISSDNESNTTQRRISPQRKHHQTPQSIKSTTELDKTLTCETLVPEDSQVKKDKVTKTDDLTDVDQKKHVTGTQLMPQPLNISNQPNMKSALEKIYYSIKSIRQITQNKHPSCLEKSNNLPDFSSHVASIFGSSSKALLAFLSVMTLKEEITNANNASCAEALKMIDSLREIANIKDSQKLQASLINLHQSASKKLLRSWRGFQEFSEKCCSTSNDSQQELSPVDCQEHVIDEIIDNLDIPEKLKEELTSLSVGVKTESEENMSTKFIEKMEMSPKNILHRQSTDRPVNVREIIQDRHVNCIIKNFTTNNQDTTNMRKPTDQGITGEDVTDGSSAEDKLNHKITNKNGNMSPEGEMQTQSEESMSIPENEHMSDDESFSKEEGRMFSSANKDIEQNESSRKSVFSSNTSQRHSSEEEQPDVECEETKQERSDGEDLSNPDSYPEEEDDQKSSSYYVELNVSGNESISSRDENQSLPDTSSEPESLLKSQKEPEIQKSCMGLNISDESTGVSDVDEPVMSGEDQPDGECKELKVIIEECLSETEEEEGIEDEEHLDYVSDHEGEIKKCKEETDDDKEELHIIHGDLRNLIENQVPYTKKDIKRYRFSADEDSGNDHSSCGEQVEVGIEQPKTADEHVRSSTEELSYYEKELSLEEERVNIDKHKRESCKESPALHAQSELTTSAKAVEKFKHEPEIMLSQSVAERVNLLQKQVEDAQKTKTVKESPAARRFSQRNIQTEADVDDSPTESPPSQSVLCTRSAPQSSLSFSYDSSGVITTEPEGNRVKSIRDMFLAKSATDIKQGPKRFQSPKASEQCDLRTETSASGGYQSQTASELSSGEEDTPRKSIAKGFVRRTIERLYGKKDPLLDEELGERPPSASKQKKKEHSSIFSPFHISRNKTMSELSYFNSSNALDAVTEATRCIAFNAQVGPGDSVPIDNGRWLLRENTLIRKSVSDPVGINKTFSKSPLGEEMCKDTEQSTKSEIGDKKSLSRKCTYFSLPYGSDSELCQDEMSTATKNSTNADCIIDMKDNSEDTKTWAERNGNFKMMDNKVHPLTEAQSGGGVVIAQPQKGQGVVNRRIQFQEPDMLDILYNFCGQNCPIL